MKRRELIKNLSILPLVGGISHNNLMDPNWLRQGKRDIFKDLGIRTFINCHGTITTKSGSIMHPEVLQTIQSVSQTYVMMEELQRKVGARLAELLHAEAAMVTTGAASAILLGTAGCITGSDMEKIKMIPEYVGDRPEVIIQKSHRFGYDHAIRTTGAKIVEVEGPEEMESAINKNTKMMFFYNAASNHSVSREEFVAIGKRHNIPTFNDASADVPPIENFFKYIKMGFDLVTYSGGKGLMGPQSTGMLLGRKDLIEASLKNKMTEENSSNTIGRVMKVNKEEILGLLVAVELYLSRDHEKEYQMWIGRINRIKESAESIPSVKGEVQVPPGPANRFPYLSLTWDESRIKLTPQQAMEALRNGSPSIEVSGGRTDLRFFVMVMLEKEVNTVARRIKEVLQGASV